MLGAYNEAPVSGVCVLFSIAREKAQLHLICLVGLATIREKGVPCPRGSAS
jgi:hypothetical protein